MAECSYLAVARLREVVSSRNIYKTAKRMQMWGNYRISAFASFISFWHPKLQMGKREHLEIAGANAPALREYTTLNQNW